MGSSYEDVFNRSLKDPEGFWSEAAQEVAWIETWDQVIDASNPPFYRWFSGGVLNTCYNAVDVHVENGRANQAALIYDSPVTDTVKTFTYLELRDEIASFAGTLASTASVRRRSGSGLRRRGVSFIRSGLHLFTESLYQLLS